jgi:hypothetical protein
MYGELKVPQEYHIGTSNIIENAATDTLSKPDVEDIELH